MAGIAPARDFGKFPAATRVLRRTVPGRTRARITHGEPRKNALGARERAGLAVRKKASLVSYRAFLVPPCTCPMPDVK